MKIFTLKNQAFIYSLVFISFLFSCQSNNNSTSKNVNKQGQDTVITSSKVGDEKNNNSNINVNVSTDTQVANISRFIAGLPQKTNNDLVKYEKYNSWKRYAALSDTVWKRLNARKIKKMNEFTKKELADINKKTDVVFYPFSGPDFLNMFVFFPDAKQYIMAGLENVGNLPDIKKFKHDTICRKYFKNINTSLNDILNISFFKTKDMAVDFKNEELNGNLAVMVIFIERTGNEIMSIKPISLNSNGDIINGSFNDTTSIPAKRITGTQIIFKTNKDEIKTLVYFSVNLADFAFNKLPYFKMYIKKFKEFNTYIKSASYLMHKAYFSQIRKIILDQSYSILEDDSGIPLKFFKPDKWDIKLYGKYVGPIKLFETHFQDDLDSLYNIPNKVKPLPFGIGYQFRYGQSNLLLAIKK